MQPDRWRDGDNRRSLIAVGTDGALLGHCRGIDNVFHPDSRTYVQEIAPSVPRGPSWDEVADALLAAQRAVSTLPLRMKPQAHEEELIALAARHGGAVIQLMPPWRHLVDATLRSWAQDHAMTADGLRAEIVERAAVNDDTVHELMLGLYVEHYTAQHARWSPAATPDRLREENAPDFVPGAAGAFDPRRTATLRRGGQIVAQALVWPPEPDGAAEVTLQSRPYEGPTTRADMAACLAAVVEASADGDVLLIDSHLTEPCESALLRDVPKPSGENQDPWTAIVAIPVPGRPVPAPLPVNLVPEEPARAFAAMLGA